MEKPKSLSVNWNETNNEIRPNGVCSTTNGNERLEAMLEKREVAQKEVEELYLLILEMQKKTSKVSATAPTVKESYTYEKKIEKKMHLRVLKSSCVC